MLGNGQTKEMETEVKGAEGTDGGNERGTTSEGRASETTVRFRWQLLRAMGARRGEGVRGAGGSVTRRHAQSMAGKRSRGVARASCVGVYVRAGA